MAVRARHCDWCVALAEQAPAPRATETAGWQARFGAEHDNLRVALAWCLEHDPPVGLRLFGLLGAFWHARSAFAEGCRWLARLLEAAPDSTAARSRALLAGVSLGRVHGELNLMKAWGEEGLALSRKQDDPRLTSEWLGELGSAYVLMGEYEPARELLEEGVTLSRTARHPRSLGLCLYFLGRIAQFQGDYSRARALMEEAIALGPVVGSIIWSGSAQHNLGLVILARGDLKRARALAEESLALAGHTGSPPVC